MKKTLFLILVILASCHQKVENQQQKLVGESVFYTCAMDPQVKESKPGKCPICHMQLIPMKKTDDHPNEISLSKQQIKLGNITTQSFDETQNKVEQHYTAVVAVNEDKLKTIASRSMGRIEKLFFKATGDYIKKNQPIYTLYSEDLAVAKHDYLDAFKQMAMPGNFGKNASNLFNAARQKLLFYGLSNQQLESIKKSNDVSPNTIFYSNYSGYVNEVALAEGSYVMEGTPIYKLVELNNLWIETQVNVNGVNQLRLGQTAVVTFTDFPGKEHTATVTFINPEINPDTRLLLIRLQIPNNNNLLKPGMQALVKLTQNQVKGVFIPIDAVIREENASYIWIEKKPGVFENVMVMIGQEINGLIEITSGIDTSQKIVITGAYAINSEYIFRKGSNPMEGMEM